MQLMGEYRKKKPNLQEEKVLYLKKLSCCFNIVCVNCPKRDARLATPSASTCIFLQGYNKQLISQLSFPSKVVL